MEEINLVELFKYFLKKIPIMLIITLLIIIIGYAYIIFIQVPMYHGTTTIILVQRNNDKNDTTYTQNELIINEKLVTTYSEIIKSRTVLNKVINDLNLDEDVTSLAKKIEVVSVSETSIIKITVSDKSSDKAVTIANKIADTFKSEVTKIYNLENISIIDEAIREENPYNVNLLKQSIIFAGTGLIISFFVVFLMYYFDNTIKSKKEIETELNLPVLAEIPHITKTNIGATYSNNNKKNIEYIDGLINYSNNNTIIKKELSASKKSETININSNSSNSQEIYKKEVNKRENKTNGKSTNKSNSRRTRKEIERDKD